MKWNQLPYANSPEETEEDTVVRQSTINQLQLCGGRVALQSHPEYLPMVSEPLAFGTCVHYIIEQHTTSGEPQEDLLLSMPDWVGEILETQYEWSLDRVPNVGEFFSEITVAYQKWMATVAPKIPWETALSIEEEYRMFLGEGLSSNIWLQGTADLVLPKTLMDWKTSGRAWKQAKADFSIQASLYMPLHKANDVVTTQSFVFWVYNRQGGTWERLSTARTVAQINSALESAFQYGLQLESGVLPYTPVPQGGFDIKRGWYCSAKWCNAWNACNVKFLNDKVNEKVQAVRAW